MKEKEEHLLKQLAKCPVCASEHIDTNKQGFKAGRALIGKTLLGPAGVLMGEYGKDNLVCKCEDCGHKWKIKLD